MVFNEVKLSPPEKIKITLTPEAIEAVKREIEKCPSAPVLHVDIKGGGCSGFEYVLDMEIGYPAGPGFYWEQDGVRMRVGLIAHQYLKGVTIGYKKSMMGEGFTFDNPNAKRTCGCGSSFSAE